MIDQVLSEIVQWLWDHTFGLVDPFWWWAIDGAIIIAACFAAAWFFSILRPIAGAVVMATVAFLVGYWKGEKNRKS